MTCIAAATNGQVVVIGGDSAAVAGDAITIGRRPKVFVMHREDSDSIIHPPIDAVIGYTTSFRMGQLLEKKLEWPRSGLTDPIAELPDRLRKCFKEGGYLKKDGEREEGGCFLLGWSGMIFQVDSDFQILEIADPFHAVGCGAAYARGALAALCPAGHFRDASVTELEEHVRMALRISAQFSSAVRGPFHILKAGQ